MMQSQDDLTHTAQVAKEHPEAVKAVADRMGGEAAEFLYRVLEEQGHASHRENENAS